MTTTLAPPFPLFADRMRRIGTEAAFALGARIAEVEAAGDRVIRCNLGQPDFPLPGHIAEAVKRALDRGLTTYCDPQGIPELRKAIARSVGEARGLDIDPARVVVYPGGRPSIGFAHIAYNEGGEEVIYPSPGYPLFESFIPYFRLVPVPVVLREENRRLLAESRAHVVWLLADVDVLLDRVRNGAHRPLLDDDPERVLAEMFEQRAPLYREVADAIVSVDHRTVLDVAQAVVRCCG